jgi:hypothetical protein
LGRLIMKLEKLILVVFNWFRRLAGRTPGKPILRVPLHHAVDKPEMQPVIVAAADQIVRSQLLWKWVRYDGSLRLCQWDSKQQLFLRGTVEDWVKFIGEHWRTFDTNHVEYSEPSLVVTDRLISAVLSHPNLAEASWSLQLQKKREAAK